MTKSLTPDRERDGSLREPAVLRRLPNDAQYTFVKLILEGVPDILMAGSWRSPTAPGRRTYAGLDCELSKREAALEAESPHATDERRSEVEALRHSLVMQLLGETEVPERGFPTRRISIRWVDPARLGMPPDLPNLAGPGQVVEILEVTRKGPVLLERQGIAVGPPPWGDERIPWIEPSLFNQTLMTLIREYFRPILRRRIGARWRNRRAAPGWPVLTGHVVPALYDYLRPLYPVRRYRRGTGRRECGNLRPCRFPPMVATEPIWGSVPPHSSGNAGSILSATALLTPLARASGYCPQARGGQTEAAYAFVRLDRGVPAVTSGRTGGDPTDG